MAHLSGAPFWLCLLLASGALAGCASSPSGIPAASTTSTSQPAPSAAPVPGPRVDAWTDPAGDAYDYNANWAVTSVPCVGLPEEAAVLSAYCYVGYDPCGTVTPPPVPPTDVCRTFYGTPAGNPTLGAKPAAPARDLTALRFQETSTSLDVLLEVASLDSDFSGAVPTGPQTQATGKEGTTYVVGWTDQGSCIYSLFFTVAPVTNGLMQDQWLVPDCTGASADVRAASPCRYKLCSWGTNFSVEFGAPATIRWSIPRTYLPNDGVGMHVLNASAVAANYASIGEYPEFSGDGLATFYYYRAPNSNFYAFDVAYKAFDYALTLAGDSPPAPTFPVILPSEVSGAIAEPELQILDVRIDALADRYRIDAKLGVVTARPEDHMFLLQFGLPGYMGGVGYIAEGANRTALAFLQYEDDSQVAVPVSLTLAPGSPGHAYFDIAYADLPQVAADDLWGGFWGFTAVRTDEAYALGPETVQATTWAQADSTISSPAYRLGTVQASTPPAAGQRFSDSVFDTAPPPDLLLVSASRFDLMSAEFLSTKPGEIRISLGVLDLSFVGPAPGYDAVFHALAVETDRGRVMVGHYQGPDRPAGADFCAQDTGILSSALADPVSADWTSVLGIVSTASGAGGSGAGARSSGYAAFIFFVPASCFGLDSTATHLNITSMKAASYLIRRYPGSPVPPDIPQIDFFEADHPFSVAFAQPAKVTQPDCPAYICPFGTDQGWNIIGAVLGLATVLGTFAIFVQRRRIMKTYMREMNRLEKLHVGDPIARALALVALRRRLHKDILKHRVSDPDYILDRLRGSITSARLVTLGEGFYDLPTALALRIERLLDDGRLTREEKDLLTPLIGKGRLAKPVHDRLVHRLDRWVAEDAGETDD